MNLLIHPKTNQQVNNFIESPLHALGLSGESGAGKRTLGQHIAAKVLNMDTDLIDQYPYFRSLDGSTKVGIDEIRKLQSFLNLRVPGKPAFKRAVLIENLDALRHEAQNALLKTIEEPPADTLIIVTYSLPNRVLPTLHSRIQHVKVMPIDLKYAEQALGDDFNQNLIKQSYYMSGGLPGIMSSLLQNEDSHPFIKAVSEAKAILSMTRFERLQNVDKFLKNKEVTTRSLLEGLYRLMDASYKQALERRNTDELKPYAIRLKLIEQATSDLQANVQVKLILSRLFTEL